MDNDARKADIRRRVILMRYPERAKAMFTDANDHNPLVLRRCPRCHGCGRCGESLPNAEVDYVCDACNGSGVIAEVEPYFTIDAPAAEAVADAHGWVTCPTCGWRFTPRDTNAWTGRRHRRCGQKIVIRSNPSEAP